MKQALASRYSAAAAALLLAAGCSTPETEPVLPQGVSSTQDAQAGLAWTTGTLAPGALVAPANLRILPGVNDATGGGGLVGAPFWKSNNPEAITGEGWLMTNGGNAADLESGI